MILLGKHIGRENGLNEDEMFEVVEREGVRFIQMQFTDILGGVKTVTIPVDKFGDALDRGVIFDGSSIVGYATIEESDMRLQPDINTFLILPWTEGRLKTARILCNVYYSSGKRFEGDPRLVLERIMGKAKNMGYVYCTGPEFEFFLFKLDERGNPTTITEDYGGYFDLMPLDEGEVVRKEIVNYANMLGFDAEASHHEVAGGQHEVDIRYADALTTADRIVLLKHLIKTVALMHNLHASFMPKPVFGVNGNGMHVHQSLITLDGKNAFYDPNGKYELSDTAYYFLGGLLKYARETCAILASWVNSYKRLVPGYEAPVYVSWANRNRSALVRVPAGRGMSTRFEMRNPDPAGNPYLQFSVMLASGLKGIEEKIIPPEPVEKDIYKLSPGERKKLGIEKLPESLGEALEVMSQSELMRETLGDHIFTHFLHIKTMEWEEYRAQVTQWEIDKFLPIL